MVTYKQLQKEFDKHVKELQDNCKHKKTQWMEKWFALGHSAGYQVKICLKCNKIIEENPTEKERKDVFYKEIEEHIIKLPKGKKTFKAVL